MAPRRRTPRPDPARAWRALARRPEVRAAREVSRELGAPLRIVGGAVRDAFLGRPHADLDLTAPAGLGRAAGEALARRLGVRAVEIGADERRIVRVPWHRREVDVWEAVDPLADLMRRDFRVNAMAFELPDGHLVSPDGALDDLAARRLAPPRPGVYLEDPLRVLRAVRLALALGFEVDPAALPELRRAAELLPRVAAERKHAEMTLLLSSAPRDAARELGTLEDWGALPRLMPGTTAAERRRGIALVGRAEEARPDVARVLLASPLGPERALATLEEWKVSRVALRMAKTLLALPLSGPKGRPSRRETVLFLRSTTPFAREAELFLLAAGDAGARRLARAARTLAPDARSLQRILVPRRPIAAPEVARLLGIGEGPELGAALAELDVALASGEVTGVRAARAYVLSLRSAPPGATLNRSRETREGS